MPNIDLIVATYPELPKILSYIGLFTAVMTMVFFVSSIVAVNRAQHHIPGAESKATVTVALAAICATITLITFVTSAIYL